MVKVKLVDLYNVKFEDMESKINAEVEKIENSGNDILEIKTIGDSLQKCAVFIVYAESIEE